VDRARREGPDIVPAIQRVVQQHGVRLVWIERVAFQLAIVQEARRAGIPVRELTPDKDKVARAMPVTAAFEGGRLLLPSSASWLRDLEQEVLSFPLGQHDDQVDCLGYAVAAAKHVVGPRAVSAVRREPYVDPASPFADPRPASPFERAPRLFDPPARLGRSAPRRVWP